MRIAYQFSQFLSRHPNLHPIRVGHGLWQCGELNERSVNTPEDVDKCEICELAGDIF